MNCTGKTAISSVTGAASGAASGAAVGGWPGAIVGGIAGLFGGLFGGMKSCREQRNANAANQGPAALRAQQRALNFIEYSPKTPPLPSPIRPSRSIS